MYTVSLETGIYKSSRTERVADMSRVQPGGFFKDTTPETEHWRLGYHGNPPDSHHIFIKNRIVWLISVTKQYAFLQKKGEI